MKTQRRGDGVGRTPSPDDGPLSGGTDEVVDADAYEESDLDDAEYFDDETLAQADELDDPSEGEVALDSDETGDSEDEDAEVIPIVPGRTATKPHSANGNGRDHVHAEPRARSGAGAAALPPRRPRASTGTSATPVAGEPARSVETALPRKPARMGRPAPAPSAAPVAVAEPVAAGDGVEGAAAPRPERPTLRQRAFHFVVTYENLFFLGIFVLALVTRVWDLGNRGIHHDESLHSVYSRNLYIGSGYQHDPMMHGPLQFHLIAFMYWLFGTSDASARLASVACGIFVVMSPFFLRKQMGRWPALIASFLLLVSPSVLYFSRMAREDSIFSGMEMIMIVGLWRFVSTRRPADFFITMAGLALMLTIKETAYLTIAVLGVFFVLLFALQAGYAIIGALAAYGVVMGGVFLFINGKMKDGSVPQLPDIPATNPDYNTIITFVNKLLTHPLVLGALIVTIIFIVALVFLFGMQRRRLQEYEDYQPAVRTVRRRPASASTSPTSSALPSRKVRRPVEEATAPVVAGSVVPEGSLREDAPDVAASAEGYDYDDYEASEVWDPKRLDPKPRTLLGRYQPGSLPYLLGSLFARPSVIVIGLLVAFAIYAVFYTVFFTDVPRGLVSGIFGSLGYWMAQHGVERGGQPWYYYMLLVPLYEPIAVFFSLVAGVFFGVKGVRGLLRRREDRLYGEDPEPGLGLFNVDRSVPFAKFSVFLPLFTIWWLAGAFAIYSWAGEKMPWLMIHMTRPAIMLASLFLGALAASLIRRRQERLAEAAEYEAEWATPLPAPALASGGVPTRRRAAGAAESTPVRRRSANPVPVVSYKEVQEPPWVTWNRPGSRFPAVSYLGIMTILALAWGLKLNELAYGNAYGSWGVSWLYPAMMIVVTVAYGVWLGPMRALKYLALGIFSVMFLYQFRSAVNLTYQHPDVPTEMAVYVQTSPDVTRSVAELNAYSDYATGGRNLKVVYDSFTSWPFEWYLRDYKNKLFIGGGDAPTGADTPIMFLEYAKHNNDPKLSDYLVQRYAMRWWFPEDWYKSKFLPGQDPKTSPALNQIGGAINTTWLTVTQPELTASIWRYLIFRQTPMPLGSEDMVVAIRKDVAQTYHYIQYDPPPSTDLP